MRATSSATLPLPITTARSAASRSTSRSVWSGWPLYQPTNSVAACEPGQLFAGDPQGSVRGRAGRVDDRVVAPQQLLARDVLAEGDVAEVAEARVRGRLLVDARDRLDLRDGRGPRPSGRGPTAWAGARSCPPRSVPRRPSAGAPRRRSPRARSRSRRCGWGCRRSWILRALGVRAEALGGWARPDSNGRPPRCKRGALAN